MSKETTRTFTGVVSREASKELTKQTKNGPATYVLHNVEITEEGPLKGKTVTGQRTLLNSEGEEKSSVEVGQEVVLYLRVVEDDKGNKKPFFDIGTDNTASDEEILLALGETVEVDASQHI